MAPRSPRGGRIRPSAPPSTSMTARRRAGSRTRPGRLVPLEADARRILERVTDAFFALDQDWCFTYVNPEAERLLLRSAKDLLGRDIWETFPEIAGTSLGDAYQRAMRDGATVAMEIFYPPLGGWFDIQVYPATNGLTVYFRNIDAQRTAASLLAQSETRYRHIVEQVPAIIYTEEMTAESTISYISPFVEELLGDPPAAFIADRSLWTRRIHPDDRRRVQEIDEHATATGTNYTAEYRMVARDGQVVWVHDAATPVPGADGRLVNWQGVVRDITARKAVEDDLRRLAHRDTLTGLSNRTFLDERLGELLVSEPPGTVAVLFIDLDRFKFVNDAWGHTAGDTVLATLAQGLSAELGAAGTLSRFGGDEFVAVIPRTSPVAANRIAGRLLTTLRRSVPIAGREVVVGGSIGITINQPGQGVTDLTREASLAARAAKGTGRDRIVHYAPHLDRAGEEFLLIADLRQAIEHHQLALEYQPIIDVATGAIVTVEALLRWDHPHRGRVSPTRFIPLAEETGLILPLGDWVVDVACRQLQRWDQDPGLVAPPQINVNVAARQLTDPAFLDRVLATLDHLGLAPSRLRLEISERTDPAALATLAPTLETFHAHGISLSLDDFGAGTSSLAHLRVMRAADLKLDHGFIQRLSGDGPDRTIVAGITSLAHALGMVVTAEGIESVEQLDAVRAAGCDRVQGWLLAAAMPASDMTAWLTEMTPSSLADQPGGPGRVADETADRDGAPARPLRAVPAVVRSVVPGARTPVSPDGPVVPDVVRAPVAHGHDADASGPIS